MEVPQPRSWEHDIEEFFDSGLPGFLARHPEDGSARLLSAYDESWHRFYDAAFGVEEPEPAFDQITGAFRRIWSIHESPNRRLPAYFAAAIFWKHTLPDESVSFLEGEGSFYEGEFRRKLEALCRDGDITGPANSTTGCAEWMMQLTSTIYVHWMMPGKDITEAEAQITLLNGLTGGAPHPLS